MGSIIIGIAGTLSHYIISPAIFLDTNNAMKSMFHHDEGRARYSTRERVTS